MVQERKGLEGGMGQGNFSVTSQDIYYLKMMHISSSGDYPMKNIKKTVWH